MNTSKPLWRSGRRPSSLTGAVVIGAAMLSGVTALYAIAPGNKTFGNQATASYLDSAGTTQQVTSNTVSTTVSQVGGLLLTSASTKSGAPNSTLYMSHTLTNTGNGPDTFKITVAESTGTNFSKVEVYADVDGDGVPDSTTPLCSTASGTACTTGFTTPLIDGSTTNNKYNFVVAYSLVGANSGTWPASGAKANVVATATTAAMYSPTFDTNIDTINLTSAAAFAVTKAVGAPSVAAPGGGAWPLASATNKASSSAVCSTAWTPGMTSTATCSYAVYTLKYVNNGASAGNLHIKDALPSGMDYVTGSAVWSGASGTALGDGAGADPSGIDYQYTTGPAAVQALINGVGPAQSGTLSFVVLVKNTATVGGASTTNIAGYSDTSCAAASAVAGSGCDTTNTNPSAFNVSATYGVVTSGTSGYTTPDSATPPPATGAELVVQPKVIVGGSVKFDNYVTNTGNAGDTFNVSVSNSATLPGGAVAFPAGTVFTFFAADGATPLLDTNGDGIPDTGPMATGGLAHFVVQAQIPATTTIGSTNLTALVTAKSATDTTGATKDSVWNQVSTVISTLVDVTSTANPAPGSPDIGAGPSASPTDTKTTEQGVGVTFPVFIKNNDSGGLTFDLSSSQSPTFPGTLPPGWTVKFVAAGGTCASPAITTAAVAAGAQVEVEACVTPPPTATIGTQPIYFHVASTTPASSGVIVSDTIQDAVNVTAATVRLMTLASSNTGQVTAGGSVVYAHTLTNAGNQSCGAFNVTATPSAADATAGWTTAVYIDVNGNGQLDATDTLLTTTLPAMATGASKALLVKVFAPGGALAGASDTVTLTVTDTAATPCATVTATDVSTVVTGTLRVYKYQALDALCTNAVSISATTAFTAPLAVKPGQCVQYLVKAVNEGAAAVANVKVFDVVPAYTSYPTGTYVGAVPAAATACASTNLTGTAVSGSTSGSPVTSVACASAANSLAPGGTVTLRFAVVVNP